MKIGKGEGFDLGELRWMDYRDLALDEDYA